jgi:hypothetical protein
MLIFNNLIDSSNVSSSSINISWTYNNDQIAKITLNGKDAVLDKTEKTFRFENIAVPNRENDLIFKVTDSANDTLSKFVYTVYYNAWTAQTTTWWNSSSFGNPQTYDVNGSDFTFTSPTTGSSYSTTSSQVTIQWKVLASWIDKVTINDYQLNSYSAASWTWRYHAFAEYNNLAVGTNVYTIKYFSNENLVYTNSFTIIKGLSSTNNSDGEITEPQDPTQGSKENPEPVKEPDVIIVP